VEGHSRGEGELVRVAFTAREIGATRGERARRRGGGSGPIGGEVAGRPLGKVGFDLCRRARRPIYLYKLLHKI